MRFGDQRNVDAIGAIEQCERLAYGTAAFEAERIEHGQLAFELRFENFARDREAVLGHREQRLRSAKPCIVQAADRSRQDRAVVIELNKRRLGVVEPAQRFERHEAGLCDDDKPLDPARRLGEAALAALPADPVADG